MRDPIRDSILRSNVNTVLALMFVGTFAFGAGLIIWHTALGTDPVEQAFAKTIVAETQVP